MSDPFQRISAVDLLGRLRSKDEHALLDVREEGVFANGHILVASNAPFSRFERVVPSLVPRLGTSIALVDDDERLAARAAQTMFRSGYWDVAILAGGVGAWAEAGHQLFSGVFVPSKAFGEFVELAYRTPYIDVAELHRRQSAGEDIVLLDSRPYDEYSWITIPGAIDCPGAELVWRVRETVPSETTLVVVSCGGRTRSIIGAQTLIDAGLSNPVMSLKDGTQGWHLAGLDVVRGASMVAPPPGENARRWARGAAARLTGQFAIQTIDSATLERFVAEQGRTTLYRFDVRTPEEYRLAHPSGFLSAPGGQLVQATDTFIAVRSSRIVLFDDDGVRARSTAAWLQRMGLSRVYVLNKAEASDRLVSGELSPPLLVRDEAMISLLSPVELSRLLASGDAVPVDFANSRRYRNGHVPGAWFAIRGRLADDAANMPSAQLFVVICPDAELAHSAALELSEATKTPVKVLDGGTEAWRAAGLPIEADQERLASLDDDVFLKAFERREAQEDAMRDYLRWEVNLVEAVKRDGTLRFSL